MKYFAIKNLIFRKVSFAFCWTMNKCNLTKLSDYSRHDQTWFGLLHKQSATECAVSQWPFSIARWEDWSSTWAVYMLFSYQSQCHDVGLFCLDFSSVIVFPCECLPWCLPTLTCFLLCLLQVFVSHQFAFLFYVLSSVFVGSFCCLPLPVWCLLVFLVFLQEELPCQPPFNKITFFSWVYDSCLFPGSVSVWTSHSAYFNSLNCLMRCSVEKLTIKILTVMARRTDFLPLAF